MKRSGKLKNWNFAFLVPSSTLVRTVGFERGKFGSTPNGTTSRNNEIILFRTCDHIAGVIGDPSCLDVGPASLTARLTGASPVRTLHVP